MRFTPVFLSVLASVTFVAAQVDAEPECDSQSGGPTTFERAAALAAFETRYLPDGVYRPQAGEQLCIKCGNAEINAENNCAVQYEASRDQFLEAFADFADGENGCSNIIRVGDGADAGCLPVLLSTPGYYQPGCEISC
ncbi:hypothetical protein DE146DRAFT_635439 [Phaeosphaeria sp. MPI-PUGE-AT-0046c]|nr:hypothetical protein DE146DRAFT_635439 [Phaeosphaeria sp. MPI-PUGE-AT-0046c]